MSKDKAAASIADEDEAATVEGIDNDDIHLDPNKIEEEFGKEMRLALADPRIEHKFDQFEHLANRFKKCHHNLGISALAILITCLIFDVVKFLAPVPDTVIFFFLSAGMVPAVIWLILRKTRFHEKWVVNRYKAERIRHWKFHQLLAGPYVESLTVQPGNFLKEWEMFLGRLPNSRKSFVEESRFRLDFPLADYANAEIAKNARAAYYKYRLMVQMNWFDEQEREYDKSDRESDWWARTFLRAGVILTLLELGFHILARALDQSLTYAPFLKSADLVTPGLAVCALLTGLVFVSTEVRQEYPRTQNVTRTFECVCGTLKNAPIKPTRKS